MNGRLQRLTSLFRWIVGPLLSLWAGSHWGPWVGLVLLALFVAGPPLAMLPHFLVLRFVPPAPGLPTAPLGDLLQAWWREVVVVTRVFNWQQPWAEHREPDFLPPPAQARGRRGVVFLHGYSCNRGLWNGWMKALRARGTPFIALTQEPAFGSIDRYAPQVDAAMRAPLLRRISEETGGVYYTPQTVSALADDVKYTGRGVTTVEERDLWDMPIVLILLLGVMSAEWGYRRVRHLA